MPVNLAPNARDAMPEGGTLLIAAATDTAPDGHAEPDPGAYVRLTVADTGAGMAPETLARVTEPFFTTKEPDKGTGLGLARARGFAEQSGGALAIGSELGRGTTVTLWLPVTDAPPIPGAGTKEPEEASAVAACVLLVDDQAVVREVLARELADRGYRIVQADDGHAVLSLLEARQRVDLLITDLSMPEMDGVALIREAQRRRPKLPAILLTGHAGGVSNAVVGQAVSGRSA